MCVKKKSHYASIELLENMYQADKQVDYNWAPLILSSLRKMLIRVHTSVYKVIKGTELIDALLRNWFLDEEEYYDPEPKEVSSSEQSDDYAGPPDTTPVRPPGELPPDVASGEGSQGAYDTHLTRQEGDQVADTEQQSCSPLKLIVMNIHSSS